MKKILAVLMLLVFAVPAVFAAKAVIAETINVTLSAQSDEAVSRAILNACKVRRWTAEIRPNNEIVATIRSKGYMVSVNISYSQNGYSMAYRDSIGMRYNSRRNSIHPTYLRWTTTLSNEIKNQLAKDAN